MKQDTNYQIKNCDLFASRKHVSKRNWDDKQVLLSLKETWFEPIPILKFKDSSLK